MGWKSVKDHYDIGNYIVQVFEDNICIGSRLMHDIILISISKKSVIKPYEGLGSSEKLTRISNEMVADQETGKLAELIDQEDVFEKQIPCYKCEDGKLITLYCSGEGGFPNVTNCGQMMYDYMISMDKMIIINKAAIDEERIIENNQSRTKELQDEIHACHERTMHATVRLEEYKKLWLEHGGEPIQDTK